MYGFMGKVWREFEQSRSKAVEVIEQKRFAFGSTESWTYCKQYTSPT